MSIPATAATQNNPGVLNAQFFDAASVERRRIIGEIATLKTQLNLKLQDELTQNISGWLTRFQARLANGNVNEVKATYIDLLKDYLTDPFGEPLEEKCYVGNDGQVYSPKRLALYMNSISEQYRTKPPLDLESNLNFTIDDYPNAKPLIEWLRANGGYAPSADVEARYKELMSPNRERVFTIQDIPCSNPKKERLRQTTNMLRDKKIKKNSMANSIKEEAAKTSAHIKATYVPINNRTREFAQQSFNRLNEVENKMNQDFQQINQTIDQTEKEISNLETQSQNLGSEINNTTNNLTEAQRETKQLQKDIVDTKIELKKRKKKRLKKILVAAAIIGGCILATWALGPVVAGAGTGAKVAVLPVAGGAKIGVTIPITIFP